MIIWDTVSRGPTPVAASKITEAIIATEEHERLVRRMDDVRSMLRDSTSLDLVETLLQVLADLEQRMGWAEGEAATHSDPA